MRGHVLLAPISLVLVLVACDDSGNPRDAEVARFEDAGTTDDATGDAANGTIDGTASGTGDDRVTDRSPFPDAGTTPYDCEVGISDDWGDWAPLASGSAIPIGGSGQAGLTAQLGLRMSGVDPSDDVFAAIAQVVLVHATTGVTGDSRPWLDSVNFECHGTGDCDRAPVLVEVSHLAKLPELEGTEVDVRARALDADDSTRVLCQASNAGVLQRR